MFRQGRAARAVVWAALLLPLMSFTGGCRRTPAELAEVEPQSGQRGRSVDGPGNVEVLGGAEQRPRLPRSPEPPTIAGGCTRHAPSMADDPRRVRLELDALGHSRKDRPTIVIGDRLRLQLECRADVEYETPAEFCLQRPDGTVLRETIAYRNAETQCVGCDPYPGAPPDVCDNACQTRKQQPQLDIFDTSATALEGAYLLSVEFRDGACASASVIIEAVRPELAG